MLDLENIDWNNFKLAKAGRSIKLLYEKEPVQFCTSSLYSPFGVKSSVKDWNVFTDYVLDCSLNQSDYENNVAFKTFLDKLDAKIQELCKDNVNLFQTSSKNFDNNYTYSPLLRENGNYAKLLKLQLQRDKNGNFQSFVFDCNKDKIKINEDNIEETLCKGKVFKCIIECSKLWYYNGKIGSTWSIVQLKFNEKKVIDNNSTNNNNDNVYNNLMIID